jgi:scyllo-inositol 2-dehydrogenase (NADP+)
VSVPVGLVGFGLAGRRIHAPLIRAAGMPIAGVVTRQAESVRAEVPEAAVFDDLANLLAQPAVRLVVIATPNVLHAEQATAALRAGKHVVVDKPLAISPAEARAVIRTAEETSLRLSVFQNRRWDADFLTIRRLMAEGLLGELVSFSARWDRFRPTVSDRWRERPGSGTGVLYDLGVHLVDQVLCLFGMPEWIQADVFAQRTGAVADDGFELRMGKGRLRISLGASSLAAANGLRYVVHGTRGSYVKSGLDPQERQLLEGIRPDAPEFGVEPEAAWGTLVRADSALQERVASERGAWLNYYLELRRAIEAGSAVPVQPAEVVRGLEVLDAALRSSTAGRREPLLQGS